MVIDPELATFVESGLSILVGSANRRLVPTAMRAVAARVEPDREHLVVYIADATGQRTLADIRENPRLAVTFEKPTTHRGVQIKGAVVDVRPGPEKAPEHVLRQREGFAGELEAVGLSKRLTRRLALEPFHEIRVRIEALFVQTPGPGAGRRLET